MNQQPIEKSIFREDGQLEIVGDPWLTIQGEGPYAGVRAVFVRLAGCNLQCPLCDTDYTSNQRLMTVDDLSKEVIDIIDRASSYHQDYFLVVLTGGEPFRQNILPFLKKVVNSGHPEVVVQIETNGTLFPYDYDDKDDGWFYSNENLFVVCSPKTPVINRIMADSVINAYKYVIQAGYVDENGLPSSVLGVPISPYREDIKHKSFVTPVYVQPLDQQDPVLNEANTQAAIDSCLKHGYVFCPQLHKGIGLK